MNNVYRRLEMLEQLLPQDMDIDAEFKANVVERLEQLEDQQANGNSNREKIEPIPTAELEEQGKKLKSLEANLSEIQQ